MRWVIMVLLLLRLKSQIDCSGAECFFVQYMECTLALDEMHEALCCACLRCRTTNEEDDSTVAGKE